MLRCNMGARMSDIPSSGDVCRGVWTRVGECCAVRFVSVVESNMFVENVVLLCQGQRGRVCRKCFDVWSDTEHVERHQTSEMRGPIPLSITTALIRGRHRESLSISPVACAQVSQMNCASQHPDDRLPICGTNTVAQDLLNTREKPSCKLAYGK